MRSLWYLVVILALGSSACSSVSRNLSSTSEPRRVAKSGPVEVPRGMHLVRTRTGARWLLPKNMKEPPEREVEIRYYKAPRGSADPETIGHIGDHEILSAPKNAESTFRSYEEFVRRLPPALTDVIETEKSLNLHAEESIDLQSLGRFGPSQKEAFELPYIPIPEEDFPFSYVSDYASESMRELVVFRHKGRRYIRFFIHPNYPKHFEELIEKYGIVYHYEAVSTASPRSLIVRDPSSRSQTAWWVKPSLPKEIDGSVRINTPEKVRRAMVLSDALQAIPEITMDSYDTTVMVETAAFEPPGKQSGTIFREIHPELIHPKKGHRWLPAFALKAPLPGGESVLNSMIRKSGANADEFVSERIIRPLLRAYLSLGLQEGLPGELHTQNFYYELNSRGLPTGRMMLKDADGFRFDLELALRRGRDLSFLTQFDKPFYWSKFSNALGEGAEGVPFLGSWYYKLIRNVSGFETLAAYVLETMSSRRSGRFSTKDRVQQAFDKIALEEAQRITGIEVPRDKLGFGADNGLNYVLNRWRERFSAKVGMLEDSESIVQKLAKNEWRRLSRIERVSALRSSMGEAPVFVTYPLPGGGYLLEARKSKLRANQVDPTVGFALSEGPDEPAVKTFGSKLKAASPPRQVPGMSCSGAKGLLLKAIF
jgi:hypothetical protein